MKSTSNCFSNFCSCQRAFRKGSVAALEVLCFTPKNAKNGRFSHGFEIPQSGIMAVRVKDFGVSPDVILPYMTYCCRIFCAILISDL